ncbi:MAG: substrate-binding domain-containing protein [Candidatus Limnocylindrales bacterium]
MHQLHKARSLAVIGAITFLVGACGSGGATTAPATQAPTVAPSEAVSAGATTAPSTAATGPFTIGYSNGAGVGNGFREEQVCTAKAEVAALGKSKISNVTVIHRNTDAAGQLSDLRSLISKSVNAIVFNPNDPDALNPALAEAHKAGIVTVSVDAYVTDPNTWNLYNNQVKYAYLGAKWLFQQLGGTGTVWYTRGLAGNPADSDRDTGFNQALKEFPNIKVINPGGTFTGWDPATATQITNDFISSGGYDKVQGIWASGMGAQIVDAIKAANKKFVPIADADIGAFVKQLLDPTNYPGLVGAAVTNTASVGGAGVDMAYKLLTGQTIEQTAGAGRPNTVLLDPQILDNTTAQGKADLQKWVSVPGMDPLWPLSLSIPGWTDYDPTTVPATCKGA